MLSLLQVEVIFGLKRACLLKSNGHEISLESIIVPRYVPVVFLFNKLVLIKFDLYLHILLPIAHIIALNVLEIYHEIEFLIGVKLRYQFILEITRTGRLLIPADCGFSKVDTTDSRLEGQIRLDQGVG